MGCIIFGKIGCQKKFEVVYNYKTVWFNIIVILRIFFGFLYPIKIIPINIKCNHLFPMSYYLTINISYLLISFQKFFVQKTIYNSFAIISSESPFYYLFNPITIYSSWTDFIQLWCQNPPFQSQSIQPKPFSKQTQRIIPLEIQQGNFFINSFWRLKFWESENKKISVWFLLGNNKKDFTLMKKIYLFFFS